MDKELHAIAEPTRRAILQLIRDEERTAGDIAAHFTQTRPAISQHLRVLREAGLVSERRDGVKRYYRAETGRFDALLSELRTFWSGGLQALKRAAEDEQRRQQN